MNGQLANLLSYLRGSIRQPLRKQVGALRADERTVPEGSRRIGLALGGGGGKGGAHLGVLAALEDLGIPIDVIAGTSVGGFVGVLYAAGFSLAQIAGIFPTFALRRIATPDPTRTGLIGARKREVLLTRLLADRTFADLRMPCAVTAADLVSGRLVVIDQGPLVPAIMATTAIPGIFPPVVRGQEVLVDGGVLDNVPVDVAERMGARRVIAVQLSDLFPGFVMPTAVPENPLARLMLPPRQFASASRALDLLMAQVTELRLAQHPDTVRLRPDVGQIGTLDLMRIEEGHRAGVAAVRAATAELIALRHWRLEPPEPTPAAQPRPQSLGSIMRESA
jgi:NTE family protein